ncbi:MAG: hypothetical protein R2710_26670 [Acidimicrobiales bacterium]
MLQRALVLFEETGGRLWRVTSRGDEASMTDLGACSDIERSVRAFRLCRRSLGFDRPDSEQRLEIAAAAPAIASCSRAVRGTTASRSPWCRQQHSSGSPGASFLRCGGCLRYGDR